MAVRGRHRRQQPSRLNRASLTVTIGSALPLIGAGTAHAASVDVWEKVAACESTSRWHTNTGNGHYGGLQFTQSTWEAYGGTRHAPRADLATKDQQIAVAEKVLEGQGPRAWPTCSERAGLARGGEAPAVRAATTRSDRAERDQRPATPTTIPNQRRESYTVARGDTLTGIAADEGVPGGWQRLYAQNRSVIGEDPDLIFPGQRLTLRAAAPAKPKPGTGPSTKAPDRPHTTTKPPSGTRPQAKPDTDAGQWQARPERPAAKPQTAPRTQPVAKPRPQPAAKPKPEPVAKPRTQPVAKPKPQAQPVAKPKPQARPAAAEPRSGGLSAPVDSAPGTRYGKPGSSWSSGYHTGVDFPVPTGTSVKAVSSGRVVSAGWAGSYGYQVVIRHDDGKYSQYAHLSALTVRAGQTVSAGQRIARSGSTGNSTGPHLHFEVRTGPGYGSDIDPLTYLRRGGVDL
ncbi:peptidoglycan DD-metalloendopeptidase family protein [Streptomyces fradiae]|uniref:peptidoglycan DD-metalloendopeptidase family protein n=1 Tax=Streptomyces fradiae TaxID=1906 RepID=UPI0035BE405D